MERAQGRDEPGWASSPARLSSGAVFPGVPHVAHARVARPHRIVASVCAQRWRPESAGGAGYLLHSQLVPVAGSLHRGAHGGRGDLRTRRILAATMLLAAILAFGILTLWVPARWALSVFQIALFALAAVRIVRRPSVTL